jgi:hypothetical protein
MSTERDVTRIVRSWLEDGRTTLPDHVLDGVLDLLPATPQQRAPWSLRRFSAMNGFWKLAAGAAAVAVLALVGMMLMPRPGGVATPGVVATASPNASARPASGPASAAPSALQPGPLAPGRYRGNPVGTVDWIVTVPAGFSAFGHDGVIPDDVDTGPPDGMGFAVLWPGKLYRDPCHGTAGDIDAGTSVDDLIAAISTQPMYETSAPTPSTVGGFSGRQIDILMPSDIDFASCTNNGGDPSVPAGTGGYFIWQSQSRGGANVFAQGPGNRFHVRVLDVAGTRVVVLTEDFPGTSPANLARMDAIVGSLEFSP